MELSIDDVEKLSPIHQDIFDTRVSFRGSDILKTKSGLTFTRQDCHSLNLWGFNKTILIYKKQNVLFAYFPDDRMFTEVKKENFIISRPKNFDGFEYGKIFELEDGSSWQQTDTIKSNCSPGEKAIIKDNKILKISNWDFYINVRKLV